MKTKFKMFRRDNGVYYTEDTTNGKQASLHTRDEAEALSLLHAKNEAQRQGRGSPRYRARRSSIISLKFVWLFNEGLDMILGLPRTMAYDHQIFVKCDFVMFDDLEILARTGLEIQS